MRAIIIQARVGSTRLPGKVLHPLSGQPVLFHVVDRCRRAHCADSVAVATTDTSEDDVIVALCTQWNIPCFRGSSEDVLSRFYHAALQLRAKSIVRITADCPLIAPELIDECLETYAQQGADYAGNILEPRRLIRGLDTEVFSAEALSRAYAEAADAYDREHVTPYIRRNRSTKFKVISVPVADIYTRPLRLTLDYPEDFALLQKVYETLWQPDSFLETSRVISFLCAHPEVAELNRTSVQKP